ncbi:hypothetical protein [Thermomonas sp.]|uniref:hypothetical protein n=1 Tax=Thermomonas sp. TaxID=1971895 RepID=UPI0037832B62
MSKVTQVGIEQNTADPIQKREYIKPTFRHETVFETMALSCGKIAGTQQACNMQRKTS